LLTRMRIAVSKGRGRAKRRSRDGVGGKEGRKGIMLMANASEPHSSQLAPREQY
jgi:hypothetical protein